MLECGPKAVGVHLLFIPSPENPDLKIHLKEYAVRKKTVDRGSFFVIVLAFNKQNPKIASGALLWIVDSF